MAQAKDPGDLTWQQKLKQGVPLTVLDETKADADFNYQRRLREEEERKKFEQLKAAGREGIVLDQADEDEEGK